jgi:uncharacterized protein (TIGR02001 family)
VCRISPRDSRRPAAACAIGAALLASPQAARAEVGLNLSAVTDYRYRGLSLSDERPAASFSVSFDHHSGLYGGARLVAAQPRGHGVELVGRMLYAGVASRRWTGFTLDAGAINYRFTSYRYEKRSFDYTEGYVGFITNNINAHLYYSPNYYESHVRTLYADLGANIRPAPAMRIFGHAGMLIPVGGRYFPQSRKDRYDLKAGAAVELGQAELSLSWTHFGPPYVPRSLGGPHSEQVALGLAYFF